jgi:hypothetical protein
MERFKIVNRICGSGFGSSRNRASANVKYAEGVMVFTMQKGGLCTRHQWVDNSLSLLNYKALLLLVAISCLMQS